MNNIRTAKITRETHETQITAALTLDGSGTHDISTGIGFLDHMLTAFAVHGNFDLTLHCKGDLQVDSHHTVEDIGIVLGKAARQALQSSQQPIMRFGTKRIPMDESLAWCDLDISGRAFLVFNTNFATEKVGELETQTVKEFMQAFAYNADITLHLNVYGDNDHHKIEAIFKAFAYALREAVQINDRLMSTKGVL
jgi:imidazoleglycerol-phosphate dehydratase